MRLGNQELIKRLVIRSKCQFQEPIVDIGGAGTEGIWNKFFNYKIMDLTPGGEILADICDWNFELKQQFGTVICLDTLEHIRYPEDALENMWNYLKRDGLLILATVFTWPYHEHPIDYWRFSLPCIEELCRKAGFKKLESGWQEEGYGKHTGVYFVGKKL